MERVITEREIKVLEFDQIRQKLAAITVSPMARKLAEDLQPSANHAVVERLLKETSEGRLLCLKNAFTPSTVEDIMPLVQRAAKGSMLSGSELAAVAAFVKAVRRWQIFFKDRDHGELYLLLAELVSQTIECVELLASLNRSIDPEGNVLDGASALLSSLRRQQQVLHDNVREKLAGYIRSHTYRRYLQEALITIRSGRYVLPIKQEYRHHIEGVIHDQSSSGATIFIEPLPVVQMQNQITAVKRQEEQEIDRILYQLSGQVADNSNDLFQNRSVYANLDLIVARGRLSLDYGGLEPRLLPAGEVLYHLEQARHPLLTGLIVPLNIKLGEKVHTLVITGPNTGGKTVALKTIGLLAVMAQSGLHVPAAEGTKHYIFNQIRADIGDEQSISQSLSTFSGHMRNIISIIEDAGTGSLVLFDELGAGTDPSEGSALAMAILDKLTFSGALTVSTTHINELKLFAQVQEKMQNAAMEFDLETLAPTYRLLQGVPGQSNAFIIAGQLGLPESVLQKARSFLHRSHDQVESVIASLVEDQQRYSRESRQAVLERSKAEVLMAELEKEQTLLRMRREEILREAREEARHLVRRTKSSIDEMIKELRNIKAEGGEQPQTRAEQIRQNLHRLRRENALTEEQSRGRELTDDELVAGQIVYIDRLKQTGEIVTFSDAEAVILIGSVKVHVPLNELRKDEPFGKSAANKDQIKTGSYTIQEDFAISNTVDLRGLNLEEAQPIVDKLLDNALWAGLTRVNIIHGKGTGKLKQGLRIYLKQHNLVSVFRSGLPSEGGEGVTVVELKS
ncbi:MAG TPA: endonuclease MutS2 [Candidatus Limnocylindrales bacterium]|nr:endonuclease MutS2 [Candidatus Limnocylindrales bacterium]